MVGNRRDLAMITALVKKAEALHFAFHMYGELDDATFAKVSASARDFIAELDQLVFDGEITESMRTSFIASFKNA
jgi:hypothetical protein